MEKRDKFVIEALLGAIFLVVLILLVFFVTGVSAYDSSTGGSTITNSYNTNNYATQPTTSSSLHFRGKPYIVDRSSHRYRYDNKYDYYDYYDYGGYNVYYFDDDYYDGRHRYRDYYDYDDRYYDDRRYDSGKRYLDYDDVGALKRTEGIFGNNINNYEVYVYNRDYVGGYFTVTYYFEDYYGDTTSYSITHYVPAREEKRFSFKDISPGNYDYRYSWYEVSPKSKVSGKVYYN